MQFLHILSRTRQCNNITDIFTINFLMFASFFFLVRQCTGHHLQYNPRKMEDVDVQPGSVTEYLRIQVFTFSPSFLKNNENNNKIKNQRIVACTRSVCI